MRCRTFCCLSFTLLCVVAGCVLFGGSWLARYGIHEYIKGQILQQIIIDSPKSVGYPQWQSNVAKDQPIFYNAFSFFNLTNLEDVKKGALPIVQEVGPYVYQNKRDLIDVQFLDEGNRVQYNTWQRYEFLPHLSNGTENDVVVAINPAYTGALAQAGGETFLMFALTGPSMKLFFNFLWTTFTWDLITQAAPVVMNQKQTELIALVGDTEFYRIWANSTVLVSPEWQGMLVSVNSTSPSDISLRSAQKLFNQSESNSLTNSSKTAAFAWREALYGGSESAAREQLRIDFELTTVQMSMLLRWLNNSFNPELGIPHLLAQWQATELADLAYIQWGSAAITDGVSVTTLYPNLPFPATPEYATFWRPWNPFSTLDLETSKRLLSGDNGLFIGQNAATFFGAWEALNWTQFNEMWGLDMAGAVSFSIYYVYIRETYAFTVMGDVIASGGGLFAARTVYEWLWQIDDPLMTLISPENSNTALILNETTPDISRKLHGPDICYTGKDDVNKIQVYTQWQGATVVQGTYRDPLPVDGVNDIGQFQPFIDSMNITLWSWDTNYIRNMELHPEEVIESKGVKMIRYSPAKSNWDINPSLYQSIIGFGNLTGAHNGASVFLSNPHMYLADPKYQSLVTGQTVNVAIDKTVIDVEPNTGKVVHYDESLQINVYLDPTKDHLEMTTFNAQVKMDVIHPVLYIKQYAALTNDNANEIKGSLYTGFKVKDIFFWVCLSMGAFLIVLSSLCLFGFLSCLRKDRMHSMNAGYSALNTEPYGSDFSVNPVTV